MARWHYTPLQSVLFDVIISLHCCRLSARILSELLQRQTRTEYWYVELMPLNQDVDTTSIRWQHFIIIFDSTLLWLLRTKNIINIKGHFNYRRCFYKFNHSKLRLSLSLSLSYCWVFLLGVCGLKMDCFSSPATM